MYDTLIHHAQILDGSGAPETLGDVAIEDGHIVAISGPGGLEARGAREVIDATGNILSPGFIDTHTHDDIVVITAPEMLPKLSQGVTTVVAGNCGISAAPFTGLRTPTQPHAVPPDPMPLLGKPDTFRYPTFQSYVNAVNAAKPSVNVATFVGHTSLRGNHMRDFDRPATATEIAAMREQLEESLAAGALGLSTGLAYANAYAAPTEEVMSLAEALTTAGARYATHLRTEFAEVLDAMDEAFTIGGHAHAPVIVSHLKCAGVANWGRSPELLASVERARARAQARDVGCDVYPYSASSSLLDLKQVTSDFDIVITWSAPHPDVSGRLLSDIAKEWHLPLMDTARRLQPAGAVYHNMSEDDVQRILKHPASMIGSDGLPNDPHPHPRLWGTFPRVLGHYSRDLHLMPLPEAVRKMTGLSASRFGFKDRGFVREGYCADLVMFDAKTIADTATFKEPIRPAAGIEAVWVNGILSYRHGQATGQRSGRFLPRSKN
jgi:N-acyl-D-amino-acid deacylase